MLGGLLNVAGNNQQHIIDACVETALSGKKNYRGMDIHGCTNLTDRIAVLIVNNGQAIIDLDIAGTNLTDQFLKTLQSGNNKLEILNLWGCHAMTSKAVIDFVKTTPSLKVLILDTLEAHFKDTIEVLNALDREGFRLVTSKKYKTIEEVI